MYAALARRIKRDSRSLLVDVEGDGVRVIPPFQAEFTVTSWAEFQAVRDAGRCEYPDDEHALYGPDSADPEDD